MAIKTRKTYTRPSTSVEWHTNKVVNSSAPHLVVMQEIEAAFDLKRLREFETPDDLTLIVSVTWLYNADYDEYWSHPEVETYYSYVNQYYLENGGSVSVREIEEI